MGKQILIIGAGKSATVLIKFLQKKALQNGWYIVLADADGLVASSKWNNAPNGHSIALNVSEASERNKAIQAADIVISMMPAHLHFLIAKDCVAFGKSLFTASYVDENMQSLATAIKEQNLLFICEMGLDPGIDHMSAMELIDRIRSKKGKITGFKSHCGGLIAPESDTNPWHYKISWNPRNIILAGKAGAIYLEAGANKEKNYSAIFENAMEINVPEIGALAYYPNRDSLSYLKTYGLENQSNFVRTTLRHPAFCLGWNAIVQLGLTDENILNIQPITIKSWFQTQCNNLPFETAFKAFIQNPIIKAQFDYLELNREQPIPTTLNSNASILQWILEEKWKLNAGDKDMVVMMHEIQYEIEDKKYLAQSSLVLKGIDEQQTAMATTVGLPLAMAACAYLENELPITGLHIPTDPIIYHPILKRLAAEGIVFTENIIAY